MRLTAAGLALALTAIAATSGGALAAGRVTMPYYCTALGGGAVELDPAPGPQSYAILGSHSTASYRHCAPSDPTRCKTWKVHRFDIDCGGKAVPWYRVVAAASEINRGPAALNGTRLTLRMRPDGPGVEDMAVMPPGFAPVVGLTAEIKGGEVAPPAPKPPPAAANSTPPAKPKNEGSEKGGAPDAKSSPQATPAPAPAAPLATPAPSATGPKLAPGVITLPAPAAKVAAESAPAEHAKPDAGSPSQSTTAGTGAASPAPAAPNAETARTAATSPAAATSTAADSAGADPAAGTPSVIVPAAAPPQRLWATALLAAAAVVALVVMMRLLRRTPAGVARPRGSARDLDALSLEDRAPASSDDIHWKPARSTVFSAPDIPREAIEPTLPLPPSAEASPAVAAPPEPVPSEPPLPIELPKTRAEALEMLGAPPDASLDAARKIVDGLLQSWSPALAKSPDERVKREAHVRAIDAVWAVVERSPS